MGKTIKKCKAKNPTLSLYLLSALPCLALPCLALPCLYLLCVPVFLCSCVSLGFFVFCLYLSVPSISAYLWSLCLVGFRRAPLSLLLFVVVAPCVCLCLWGVLPLCPLWCFVYAFLYGGSRLCRGFSLVVGGSIWSWFCLGLALLLPWVALWSFWCLVVCFALVYACDFWRWCPWCCRALWAFLLVVVVLGLLDRCLGQPCAILGDFAVTGLLGF